MLFKLMLLSIAVNLLPSASYRNLTNGRSRLIAVTFNVHREKEHGIQGPLYE